MTDSQIELTLLGFIGLLAGYAAIVSYLMAKAIGERETYLAFYNRVVEARRGLQQFKYVRDVLDWILLKDYLPFKDESIIELRTTIQNGLVHDEEMRIEFDRKRGGR